ncbi:hypothetical protein FQN54_008030 [Arachnomyces sp. PD_36]|nr:hypothetical protein FQN54_008030 [Arachnomyces sp. PD_36]
MLSSLTVVDAAEEGFLSLWHANRLTVFVSLAVVVLVAKAYNRWNTRSKTAFSSSIPSSPQTSPAEKRAPWSDAKEKSTETKTSIAPTVPLSAAKAAPTSTPASKPTKPRNQPKRVAGVKPKKASSSRLTPNTDENSSNITIQPRIFFSTLTGSTERYAHKLSEYLQSAVNSPPKGLPPTSTVLAPEIHDLSYIDYDDHFVNPPKAPETSPNTQYFYCLLIPTYNIDTIVDSFLAHLDETHYDFRIDTAPLSGLAGYSVFGFGDKEEWPSEEEGFCTQARDIDRWMAKLTGKKRAYPLGLGDVKSDADAALGEWQEGLQEVLFDIASSGGLGEGAPGSGDPLESDEEDAEDDEDGGDQSNKPKRRKAQKSDVIDLEDIKFSGSTDNAPLAVDFTTYSKNTPASAPPEPKEMVPKTSPTYASLTKQGYKIIGSHSGVKICRWTKSALRGRGSCYKNSFYGIKSHLCMETTPSLSCSNKCVFCWRHGTNPVGTTWRWKVDPPELIFNGAKEGHYAKIKILRGVPGVRAERFSEAMRIRHCALSLVGEPIFYPHINEFLTLLHNEHISSFLVCNAQHPDHLEALHRVTQLYVSIDASNRDSLRKIDRPLHRDFWERFQRCLDILREQRHFQRTVFRLTLVKGFNIEDEAMGYADLVEKALPCFIEIKGVTYCGTSSSAGAGLTMQNVPFYEEIVTFVKALNKELERRGLSYGIAAEHQHSCCVLIASDRFYVDGRWHTRIDYERFFQLLEREKKEGITFRPEDYMRETEDWALWGKGGFDPSDERWYRKKKNKAIEGT